MFAKVGRPILGMYLKIGQNGTRVGRYLKKVTKKWDILYERSLRPTYYTRKCLFVTFNYQVCSTWHTFCFSSKFFKG